MILCEMRILTPNPPGLRFRFLLVSFLKVGNDLGLHVLSQLGKTQQVM